jgi:hypothetical protein
VTLAEHPRPKEGKDREKAKNTKKKKNKERGGHMRKKQKIAETGRRRTNTKRDFKSSLQYYPKSLGQLRM